VRAAFTDSESLVIGFFDFNPFIAVAVRGTMKRLNKILGDLTVDLDAKQHWIDHRAYHIGFYDDAKRAVGDLATALGSQDKPVYFPGHSMGGAISGLLPSIWPEETPLRLMTPYTFASPRLGNEFVAETYKNYAYVRAADPVRMYSPESWAIAARAGPHDASEDRLLAFGMESDTPASQGTQCA
jgi:predicted lipase